MRITIGRSKALFGNLLFDKTKPSSRSIGGFVTSERRFVRFNLLLFQNEVFVAAIAVIDILQRMSKIYCRGTKQGSKRSFREQRTSFERLFFAILSLFRFQIIASSCGVLSFS